MLISGVLGICRSMPPQLREAMCILTPTATSKDLRLTRATQLAQNTILTSTVAWASTMDQMHAVPTTTPKQPRPYVQMPTAMPTTTSRLPSSSHLELVSKLCFVQAAEVQSSSLQKQHNSSSSPTQAPCQTQAAQIPQLPALRSRILMFENVALGWFLRRGFSLVTGDAYSYCLLQRAFLRRMSRMEPLVCSFGVGVNTLYSICILTFAYPTIS